MPPSIAWSTSSRLRHFPGRPRRPRSSATGHWLQPQPVSCGVWYEGSRFARPVPRAPAAAGWPVHDLAARLENETGADVSFRQREQVVVRAKNAVPARETRERPERDQRERYRPPQPRLARGQRERRHDNKRRCMFGTEEGGGMQKSTSAQCGSRFFGFASWSLERNNSGRSSHASKHYSWSRTNARPVWHAAGGREAEPPQKLPSASSCRVSARTHLKSCAGLGSKKQHVYRCALWRLRGRKLAN